MDYELYVLDTETTGLDFYKHDVIELSILKLSTNEQKTWLIQPTNINNYSVAALKTNKHKLEDLQHKTEQGIKLYKNSKNVIVDIENWIMTDSLNSERRICVGQNVGFDLNMLKYLWIKCDSEDSFPFGKLMIDTRVLEIFFDYCKGSFDEGYSLYNFLKKYGIKNEKAHTAAADTKATKELFIKQVNNFKKLINNV